MSLIDRDAAKAEILSELRASGIVSFREEAVMSIVEKALAALPPADASPAAEQSVKKPPILLARSKRASTEPWRWCVPNQNGGVKGWAVACYVEYGTTWMASRDIAEVDRTASDPEALALYDADMAKR